VKYGTDGNKIVSRRGAVVAEKKHKDTVGATLRGCPSLGRHRGLPPPEMFFASLLEIAFDTILLTLFDIPFIIHAL
jgi:hypothetical protein